MAFNFIKSSQNRIVGTSKDDNIEGSDGPNSLFGGSGDDILFGGIDLRPNGRDHLDGGGFPQVYRGNPLLGTWGRSSGDDVLEMGTDDFGYGRDGADMFRLHTNGGPYHKPAWLPDFNLREGDKLSMAHADGITIRHVTFEQVDGNTIQIKKLSLVGNDESILDGMWALLSTEANDGWGDDFRWLVGLDQGESALHAIREMVHEGEGVWLL